MTIPNVWEMADHSAKWANSKPYKLYNDVSTKDRHSGDSAVTWIIGIQLADLFATGMIDVATLAPGGFDFRVVGPHRGGQVRRQDRHRITLLCSPKPATDPMQRQVQELNYDTFTAVMAEMIKKYAAKLMT